MIRKEDVYRIGKLGKTHGVRGEISFLFDDDVFDRVDADYLILSIDDILVPFFIEEYRFKTDSNALMKFEGIDTQERARELTGPSWGSTSQMLTAAAPSDVSPLSTIPPSTSFSNLKTVA